MRSMGGRGSCRSYGACITCSMLMLRCCCAKAAREHGTLLSRVKPNLIQIGVAASGRREPPPPVRRTAYAVYGRARLLPILWGLHHVQHAHAPLLLRKSCA